MKKFLLIASIIFIPLQALAFEDYIIVSEKPVHSVLSNDESIVSVVPFFTIDNKKDTIIVKAKREGNAEITVVLDDKDIVLKVNVMPEVTTFKCPDELACFPLDRVDNEKKEDK